MMALTRKNRWKKVAKGCLRRPQEVPDSEPRTRSLSSLWHYQYGIRPCVVHLKTQAAVLLTHLTLPKVTKSHASQAALNDDSAVPERLVIFPTLSVCTATPGPCGAGDQTWDVYVLCKHLAPEPHPSP